MKTVIERREERPPLRTLAGVERGWLLARDRQCGLSRGNRRWRGRQQQSGWADLKFSCGVDCRGQCQLLSKSLTEVVKPGDTGAELAVQRAPGDWGRVGKNVQPIGEPAVDI